MARKGDPTKSGYLTSDTGDLSTINCIMWYQESESNKASKGETNKSTKAILEMSHNNFPDNFEVKFQS